jgi:hypothetical protein
MQSTAQETDARPCRHDRLEFLGEDEGRNRYFLCESCNAVIIEDGMRQWVLHPGEHSE